MKGKTIPIVFLVVLLSSIVPFNMTQAAPGSLELVTGTIQTLVMETDPQTGATTVVVFFKDTAGVGQMARISLETAISLQLVNPNPVSIGQSIDVPDPLNPGLTISGTITALAFVLDQATLETTLQVTITSIDGTLFVIPLDLATAVTLSLIDKNPAMIGQPFQVDSSLILETDTYSTKVTLLFTVFGSALSLTPDLLAVYEEAGTSFGVLAQSLWIASSLGGDATLLEQIITAKSTSDFSAIVLPDGTTVENWGQLRKAALTDAHQNPGQIVSGKVEPFPAPTTVSPVTTVVASEKSHGKSDEEHGKSAEKEKKK